MSPPKRKREQFILQPAWGLLDSCVFRAISWVPLVPVMGVLFNGYMRYKLGWMNWARLIIWPVIGMVVYFTYSRKHSRVQAALEGRKTTLNTLRWRRDLPRLSP